MRYAKTSPTIFSEITARRSYTFRVTVTDNAGNTNSAQTTLTPQVKRVTKYYALAGKRVAMRTPEGVYYLHSDHLGSTSLLTGPNGELISTQGYYPYGGTRYGSSPTDRQFTGQRHEVSLGLYDYGARMYDPVLARFLSADTIVPQPGNPQSLNRYSYGYNNPVKYQDPNGHNAIDVIAEFALGAVYQWVYSNRQAIPYPITTDQRKAMDSLAIDSTAFQVGRVTGAIGATAQGIGEIVGGVEVAGGGTLSFATVVGPATGVSEGVVATGALVAAHGALVTARGIVDVAEQSTVLFAKTGQSHHILSKKISDALDDHPTLGDAFDREASKTQAANPESHNGYQTWHRETDKEVVTWLRENFEATRGGFLDFLKKIYSRPDMKTRFPDALDAINGLGEQK